MGKKRGWFKKTLNIVLNPTNARGAIGLGTADRSRGSFFLKKKSENSFGGKVADVFSGNFLNRRKSSHTFSGAATGAVTGAQYGGVYGAVAGGVLGWFTSKKQQAVTPAADTNQAPASGFSPNSASAYRIMDSQGNVYIVAGAQ